MSPDGGFHFLYYCLSSPPPRWHFPISQIKLLCVRTVSAWDNQHPSWYLSLFLFQPGKGFVLLFPLVLGLEPFLFFFLLSRDHDTASQVPCFFLFHLCHKSPRQRRIFFFFTSKRRKVKNFFFLMRRKLGPFSSQHSKSPTSGIFISWPPPNFFSPFHAPQIPKFLLLPAAAAQAANASQKSGSLEYDLDPPAAAAAAAAESLAAAAALGSSAAEPPRPWRLLRSAPTTNTLMLQEDGKENIYFFLYQNILRKWLHMYVPRLSG